VQRPPMWVSCQIRSVAWKLPNLQHCF
jgi:hypothetical protein